MPEKRAALFVRIPAAHARQLDFSARALGRTKQDVVTDLLAASLLPVREPSEHTEPAAIGADEVLTLDELSSLLKVDQDTVMSRVMTGELPGRRLGDQWRFSRLAVLAWLNGSDAPHRATVGFGPPGVRHPDDEPAGV